MTQKSEKILSPFLRKDLPDVRSGDTVKIYQKFKEGDKERTQIFEGIIIARKHGKGLSATITVRKEVSGIGIEKIFPLHLPSIEKIEVLKRGKTRRAKLYYLREARGKKAKLKRVDIKKKSEPREETKVEKLEKKA